MTALTPLRVEDVAAGEGGAGGVVRVLTLDDPDRRNAFTPALIAALDAALRAATSDDAVGAIVLTHQGRAFAAGTDLGHLSQVAGDAAAAGAFLSDLVGLFAAIERCPKPTIAALEGPAVGGGFELALACDLRVMGADAWAALPELGFGALPGGGGVQRLTRFVGRAQTLRLVLTGDRLDAAACAALGLAEAVPAGAARATALDRAARLAGGARLATARAKALILSAEETPLDDLDRRAVAAMVEALQSPEGVEGLQALAERRAPDFAHARRGADRPAPPISPSGGPDA